MEIFDAKGNLIQTLSGNNDETMSATVSGETMKIVFKSDDSAQGSGWKITKSAFR